jgi:phospholipase/carboxylesterase
METQQIHQGQPILTTGAPLDQARAAMIMIHGRGATADGILELTTEFEQPEFAYIAPQAAGDTWYPYPFTAPLERNEPYLSSALATIESLFDHLAASGIPPERTVLLGFSQGACLSLEFAARHAQRYGGLVGLSGGLIGPDGIPRNYSGSFDGTPIFLGCSDRDPHIPKQRVEETAVILKQLGGEVTMRLYPNMGHTVNRDEIVIINAMMADLVAK